jgi:hypothetical protein
MKMKPKLPGQIISQIMAAIRTMFCQAMTPQQWGQFFGFIRREVVTWPAAFMAGKGFALGADRYTQVMMQVFKDIKVHGDTGRVNFWPGYLQKCVQAHFRLHWEEYYREAKSARALADRAMMGLSKATTSASSERQVETLATIHMALKSGLSGRSTKHRNPAADQLPLF